MLEQGKESGGAIGTQWDRKEAPHGGNCSHEYMPDPECDLPNTSMIADSGREFCVKKEMQVRSKPEKS